MESGGRLKGKEFLKEERAYMLITRRLLLVKREKGIVSLKVEGAVNARYYTSSQVLQIDAR